MTGVNLETLKVNVTTVISIVVASFALYFFISDLIERAILEAKIYAITLDIDRDESTVEMYRFRIDNGIASPSDLGRMRSLQDKLELRRAEKAAMEAK